MIKLDLYKNKIQGHKNFGKVYARSNNNDPIDIKGLAKHIQSHGSPYTYDIILGVLTKCATCVRHLVLDGTPVKFDDLCTEDYYVITPHQRLVAIDRLLPLTS